METMSKGKVYLAGPMQGIELFNFPSFHKAADLGRALGYEVISPAEHDNELGFDETKGSLDGFDLKAAMRWDLEQITTCEYIALLPGWEKSKGAKVELAVAVWFGVKVLDATTFEPFPALSAIPKETVLEEAIRLTSNDRQKVYGHPKEHFTRTIGLFNIAFAHKLKEPFKPHEWGVIMLLDKIARFVNPKLEVGHRDCLTDTAGYSRTIEMVLND